MGDKSLRGSNILHLWNQDLPLGLRCKSKCISQDIRIVQELYLAKIVRWYPPFV